MTTNNIKYATTGTITITQPASSATAGQGSTAVDWAMWDDTIGYEIVTRVGARVPRRYVEG